MNTIRSAHHEIIQYYDSCEWDYRVIWNTDRSLALHYGFWTDGVRSLLEAQRNQNEWLANLAAIDATDRVLDAGCGIGGSSLHLALTRGCKVTGISLSHRQIERARKLAARENAVSTEFQVRDFTNTGFPSRSFSVIWAIESVCHAADKSAFLNEAFRLLKKGGRLIIADGFSTQPLKSMRSSDENMMRGWLEPWAVDTLATADEFSGAMQRIGFERVVNRDVTDLIRPSARRLNTRAQLATVPANLMYWMGLRTDIQHGNYLAGKFQWKALNRNLWHYCVFTARRP